MSAPGENDLVEMVAWSVVAGLVVWLLTSIIPFGELLQYFQ